MRIIAALGTKGTERERGGGKGKGKRRCLFAEAAYDLNFAPAAKEGGRRTEDASAGNGPKAELGSSRCGRRPLPSSPSLPLSLRPLTRLIYLPSLPSFQPLDILRSLNHQIELQLKVAQERVGRGFSAKLAPNGNHRALVKPLNCDMLLPPET